MILPHNTWCIDICSKKKEGVEEVAVVDYADMPKEICQSERHMVDLRCLLNACLLFQGEHRPDSCTCLCEGVDPSPENESGSFLPKVATYRG